MIADVTDEESTQAIENDRVRLLELRFRSRAAIAAKSGLARSRNGGYDAGLLVDAADDVGKSIDEEEIAFTIKAQFVRLIDEGFCRLTAIAAVAFDSCANYRRDFLGFQVKPSDCVIIDITKVERAIRADDETVRIVHTTVIEARCAVANQR